MKTYGTYFQNDAERPLKYGEVELINPPRQRLRGEPEKEGIPVHPVVIGFCGTDYELMKMGRNGRLGAKFPAGTDRLINGHEGVVWVPSEKRFAIVLIRGGDSIDPTRYTEDESYFEYGCDQADGLFCDTMYVHPDMLLRIPDGYVKDGKLALSFAKRMVFPDPFGCMLFQLERMEDLGSAHWFRQTARRHGCDLEMARKIAADEVFGRTVIFGLGTTGMLIGDVIRRAHPDARIVFVARSSADSPKVRFALKQAGGVYVQNYYADPADCAKAIIDALDGRATMFIGTSGAEAEHRIAFEEKVLGCNGIYNSFSLGPRVSFDTMPFGFENHLIFGSINFRQDHMEKAIEMLADSPYDEIVELIDREEFTKDPIAAYEQRIYCKAAPMKTAVIWNSDYVDTAR
uniref:Fucose utilisation protein n=1 Tax=uncultured bacterium Contigcl_1794 TaxID=1393664 RepID=W0FSZ1_9BACT|nr:fucose utilisation protein [uncultured bacterium Contigcl_1794]